MSVHIYKYGLKWLYGRNVSSTINVRFYAYCAYCAHFPGIEIAEDVNSQEIFQQYPPRWKAPSAHVCRDDGVLREGYVNGPDVVARFVVLLLLLHSRNHLVTVLLLFGLLGITPFIVVHLRFPRAIGTTDSIGRSVVNHQLLDLVLRILVPALGAL